MEVQEIKTFILSLLENVPEEEKESYLWNVKQELDKIGLDIRTRILDNIMKEQLR